MIKFIAGLFATGAGLLFGATVTFGTCGFGIVAGAAGGFVVSATVKIALEKILKKLLLNQGDKSVAIKAGEESSDNLGVNLAKAHGGIAEGLKQVPGAMSNMGKRVKENMTPESMERGLESFVSGLLNTAGAV